MSDKTIKVKLVQKRHSQEFPYYVGEGCYFGFQFEQVGEELIADVNADAAKSLIDANKFKKISANALKELVAEANGEEVE